MSALNFFLSLLFPRRCVACGKPGKYFCNRCKTKIKQVEYQVCPVCERPAIGGVTHPRCLTNCSLDGLTSFFIYDGPIKRAIKDLKYRFVSDLAKELISLTEVAGHEFFNPDFVLTPVPLHWQRQNWRGFNQSEVLGKIMAKKLGVKFISGLLVRKKNTRPQVELKSKKRQKNIEGAFIFNPKIPHIISVSKYHSIIVFDDVWTTGSTLRACGRVLKQAGVKKVWGMTLAR